MIVVILTTAIAPTTAIAIVGTTTIATATR